MTHDCLRCGHRSTRATPRDLDEIPPYAKPGFATVAEQMEPFRLVDLVARHPEMADVALLGARLAAGTLEGC